MPESSRAIVAAQARSDAFVDGVLHGGDRSVRAATLRALLVPAALLHRVGLEVYLLPFRMGIRLRAHLIQASGNDLPTIAIGNLTSGGTGKTPMAQLVATYLKKSSQRVVVLSRGHGGSAESSHSPKVVSDGFRTLLAPDRAGDEPVLLANSLPGIPVVIGRDRLRSGKLAVDQFSPDVVVLDDALQYWQLDRDLDIVLLDARRPFDNGYLLPRGLLRQPPAHLKRAEVIVLTRANRADPAALQALQKRLRQIAPRASVFTANHAPLGWVSALEPGALLPLDTLNGKRVLIFSAIADNQAFRESVEALGAEVAAVESYVDHHVYAKEELAALASRVAAEGLIAVTTEKDLVKTSRRWPRRRVPLYALRIGMEIDDLPRFERLLDRVVEGR